MKKRRRTMLSVATPDRSMVEIETIIDANRSDPTRGLFEGLKSSEIATRNRREMFGENDENFPSDEEWSRIVD